MGRYTSPLWHSVRLCHCKNNNNTQITQIEELLTLEIMRLIVKHHLTHRSTTDAHHVGGKQLAAQNFWFSPRQQLLDLLAEIRP